MSKMESGLPRRRIPKPIRWFALSYIAFAVAALTNNLMLIDGFRAELSSAIGSEAPAWLGYAGFAIRFAARLVLAWFVVHNASKVACWLIVVWGLAWLKDVPVGFAALIDGEYTWLPWLAIISLQLFAIACLFHPRARLWFKGKGKLPEDIRAAFD